ncbi:hypothetical protein CISG_04449 [Coccidioides immitis RMSCC 3703]|uniref:CUE domain-containing protein n=2 Tax=Coccidioides immitis TaxID=5501 RepID=A0A0J8QPJ1_COCIT|nr:hypothetical protein CIRG_05325 [Coccidioides immitis RMSCC 2394]KMU74376.1 hypothetical protein CISG_04449 [Coccidioides immitis RMSCC 3703]
MTEAKLPPLAPVPPPNVQECIPSEDWASCLDAWIVSVEFRLRVSEGDFETLASKDTQAKSFLSSFFNSPTSLPGPNASTLRRLCFLLARRLLLYVPEHVLDWQFLGAFCSAYNCSSALKTVLRNVWQKASKNLTLSIEKGKTNLMQQLSQSAPGRDSNVLGDLRSLTLLAFSLPEVGYVLMTGSDYIDAMFEAYQTQKDKSLQDAIVANIYVALSSLMITSPPAVSLLLDQLFNLKASARVDGSGSPKDPNLLSDLVCSTNLLKRMDRLCSENPQKRADKLLSSLLSYRKVCRGMHPIRRRPVKENKGKQRRTEADDVNEFHIHKMSLVTQIQDLFPDLGSGYVVKLLDYYSDNVETVVSHLVEDSLPANLKILDHSDQLHIPEVITELAPQSTPPPATSFTRRNVFDNDEFDRLAIAPSKLHFGRTNADLTADDILADRSGHSVNKAAILSALAAFDSDDDEHDDTYDVADVGGTVDSMPPGAGIDPDVEATQRLRSGLREDTESTLFSLYKSNPEAFKRDAATRRSQQRISLRKETGMTDESIEGWAVMLSRDPKRMARMEHDYVLSAGLSGHNQPDLPSTSYRKPRAEDGDGEDHDAENSRVEGSKAGDTAGGPRGHGRAQGRSRGRAGRGGRGGRGDAGAGVAGPSRDHDTAVARRRKDANKSSRANHSRKDQRARKVARGGL